MTPERKAYIRSLRRIRAEKNLTQEYIAEVLGCDYTTYGKIEKGISALTVERALNLALLYGVSLEKLLNLAELRQDPDFAALAPGSDPPVTPAKEAGDLLQVVFNIGGGPAHTDKEKELLHRIKEALEVLGSDEGTPDNNTP